MILVAGARLGPFEILAPIGAGGMGEVYRARDTRLSRDVAIKVLPAAVSSNPERLRRFEKEARAASSLNHPNIVTVHDIGESGGTSFIAMELVEGRTLRELLGDGALATKRLLTIGTQVADGLAKAHGAGIVHRDLKPENVMVTKEGFAKILDFGLAKLTQPDGESGSAMATASAGTESGVVMGTVGYMSPEQALGDPLDFRSDQFSFGSMLYEMATGKRAFARRSPPETMAAIIREEPEPIASLAPSVPAPFRWLVERCLAKEPEDRYAATRDLARDLASLRDHISEANAAPAKPTGWGGSRRRLLPVAAVLALAAAGLAGWGLARTSGMRTPPAPSFKRLTFRRGLIGNARFAPDGRNVFYGAVWEWDPGGREMRLFETSIEGPEARRFDFPADILAISRTGELAINLSQTPAGGTLSLLPVTGGVPRQVLERVAYAGADWAPDGKELAVAHVVDGKSRLEFPIGKALVPDAADAPRFSPDGRSIAFWDRTEAIAVIGRDGKSRRVLSSGWVGIAGAPCWAADGREIWFTARRAGERQALWSVDLAGTQRLVTRAPGDLELDDISRDGRALLAHSAQLRSLRGLGPGQPSELELSWLDASHPSDLSADGTTLLLTEDGEGAGATPAIYLRSTDGAPAVRLGDGYALAISGDKKWVLAVVPRGNGKPGRRVLFPTGPGAARELATDVPGEGWGAFTPDGKRVVFSDTGKDGASRLYVQEIQGGSPRTIGPSDVSISVLTSPVSPDGRYVVGHRGNEAWIYSIDGPDAPRAVKGVSGGERVIQWSSDSRTLYVQEAAVHSVRVWLLDPETGRRHLWKEISAEGGEKRVRVTPDGKFYVYGGVTTLSELYLVEGLR